ncbi:hypothetical protein [Nonlabens ulvanivorans]|uniref:hypothetical protein n=1 Tax=Nonlabens ulvanivorans TaxID=906888 RepID=UPI0032666C4C
MKTKLITLTVLLLSYITVNAQEDTTNWYQNLHVKVGYADNFSFSSDLNVAGYENYVPTNATFRLGLGYDFSLGNKWTLSPSAEIDWIRIIDETVITPDSGLDRFSTSRTSSGSELNIILSAPFEYQILSNDKNSFGIAVSPQINFRSFNDVGLGTSVDGDASSNRIRYESTERNRIFRPSLLLGLNYNFKLGALPVRAQAFYSHSFAPAYFGEYTYSNDFNGETQTGEYEFDGHQAGVSLAFFPFGNGNREKKEKKEKVVQERKERSEIKGSSRFGYKMGVNFSDITAIDSNTGGLSGFVGTELYGGLFIDTKISNKWNLQNEATFSFTDENMFLEIPILFKRQVGRNFWAFAGPKAQIVVNESLEIDRNFGAGLDFGFQYDLPKDFFIEARYGIGLSRQISDFQLGFEGGKRNVLRVGVGIKF